MSLCLSLCLSPYLSFSLTVSLPASDMTVPSFRTESPGSVDCVVRTWRPQGDLASKMREQFLGTCVRLKDPSFALVPPQ